jgi:pimeloyl-ACP methyl ester carboxylesterase
VTAQATRITREDIERLKKQEQAALELWKAMTRRWFGFSTTARESWRAPEPGENVLTAQGQVRDLARAWAAADAHLARALAISQGSTLELVAASNDPAPECRCYSVCLRAGSYQPVVSPECPLHGEKSA